MNNWRALRTYRKLKKNRRRLENIGASLLGIGFFLIIAVSGEESTLSFLHTVLIALGGCGVMGLGVLITNFVDNLNEEYPISLNLVEKGDRLCYTVSTTKQKASVYNG